MKSNYTFIFFTYCGFFLAGCFLSFIVFQYYPRLSIRSFTDLLASEVNARTCSELGLTFSLNLQEILQGDPRIQDVLVKHGGMGARGSPHADGEIGHFNVDIKYQMAPQSDSSVFLKCLKEHLDSAPALQAMVWIAGEPKIVDESTIRLTLKLHHDDEVFPFALGAEESTKWVRINGTMPDRNK